MDRHLDTELLNLKQKLLNMADLVENAIGLAIEGLLTGDSAKIAQVYEIEKKVNREHMANDEVCVRLIALNQPMATDLRFIVASIKINTDLERMGDQAVNIALNAERYIKGGPLAPLKDITELREMCTEVRLMVRKVLDSFVSKNGTQALEVLLHDDQVDAFKNKIFHIISSVMKTGPQYVDQGLNLILIARNLEKIGDHASNIAEDVIYVASGKDVRHPGLSSQINKT